MYPLMGAAISVSTQAVQNSIGTGNLAIMNLDNGNFSMLAVQYFTSIPNVTVNVVEPEPISTALADAQHFNATTLVVIPDGFTDNITSRNEVYFETYTPLKTFATTETAGPASSRTSSARSRVTSPTTISEPPTPA